ncbi:MAG: acetolactate synthase small subunit [Lachnospiraceae bacterium]|nr:acetolactate synthase small subunit [Lachnospiraceae bacterium]
MKQRVLSILVENTAGVLSRVSGLFSRRGYNIDSLTVGVTADPKFSRMTVVCTGDELILEQITKQLAKLVDVRDIKLLNPDESVCRELILVKVLANAEQRQNVIAITDIFRAKIVDVGTESLIAELTGTKNKLDAFLNLLEGYEILELARTGITGLSRGKDDVRFLE